MNFTVRKHGSHVVLSFCTDEESGEWIDGEGWLASLVSLRADILRGGLRAPYIAWLLDVQWGLAEDGDEPPLPPGLNDLSAPLKALAEFLGVDDDILAAAAEASDPLPAQTPETQQQWHAWLRSLDEADKDALLYRVASGDATVQWELQKQFRRHLNRTTPRPAANSRRHSISDILAIRDRRVEDRRQRLAETRERTKRKKAAERKAYLTDLVPRQDALRDKVSTLISTTQQRNYDQAVRILTDLRDSAAQAGAAEPFARYLAGVRATHARKSSLIRRLDQAGL